MGESWWGEIMDWFSEKSRQNVAVQAFFLPFLHHSVALSILRRLVPFMLEELAGRSQNSLPWLNDVVAAFWIECNIQYWFKSIVASTYGAMPYCAPEEKLHHAGLPLLYNIRLNMNRMQSDRFS